ncbi:MAG: hypothetical protein ACTHW2_08610 [Tissierella sp.]|uniref:hypothetical protein n=1 Tax=Tissierella sp. TaxID=41274 RepID=UPI003F96E3DA
MDYRILIVAVTAACITYYLSIHLKKGPVLASAIVTLLSGLLLPAIFEDGSTLAIVATTVSYAAMVSTDKFPKIYEMIVVGIISGIIFILAEGVFIGVGGKLGSIAAISGLSWFGFKEIFKKIKIIK